MKIAIGTLRTPKIDAIKEGVASCPYFAETKREIAYITESVDSGITHMPTTMDEIMEGAKNRAKNLKAAKIEADYYIGMEGGTSRFGERAYTYGCVYIENATGEGHYGFSPMVEVPAHIERMIYDEGKELGPIMDELSGVADLKSGKGSIALWTDDMFSRKEEFILSFNAAIAPFFNKYYRG